MERRPGKPIPYRVSLPGREPLTIDLMRTEGVALRWIGGALFQKGGREIQVVLVDAHQPLSSEASGGRPRAASTPPTPKEAP